MRPTTFYSSDIIASRVTSEKIKLDVDAFLANGGKIQQIAYGVITDADLRVSSTTKANRAESKNGRNINSSASTNIRPK